MKRVLLSCFLLAATVGVTSVLPVAAYAAPAGTPVTQAAFNTKVNLMDSHIAAGNMTAAQATWQEIHTMMLSVLGASKTNIHGAATPAAEASFRSVLENQTAIYNIVWGLKTDLAANRAAIHAKLGEFSLTI
jgi:hypothetical protein